MRERVPEGELDIALPRKRPSFTIKRSRVLLTEPLYG